jgi:hypothetical protein
MNATNFQETHPMKASAFDESSSSSVLWVINAVQEHSTSFQGLSNRGLRKAATSMI